MTTPAKPQQQKSPNQQPKNIIYYGVPGTGKTYHMQQLMQQYTDVLGDDINFVANKLTALSWREIICLVLLAEKRLLKVNDIAQHRFVTTKNLSKQGQAKNASIVPTITNELHRFSNPASTTISRENINHASNPFFDKDASGAWFILPEAQPQLAELTHLLTQIQHSENAPNVTVARYTFVSFHQSYGYEEFVEGLRPVLDENKQLTYQVQQGAFVRLCEQAKHDPSQRYAVFIDEINRANVSKVFGELLTLIETNKRMGMPHAASVRLAYSGMAFSVPENVDIYATMNVADRSLAPLDSAFRRRFEFVAMLPQPHLLATDVAGINLAQLLTGLNVRIAAVLGQDYVLGHAAFMAVHDLPTLNALMAQQIIPLLQEYCFSDWHNLRAILADDAKPVAEQFIVENEAAKILNIPMAKPVYEVNKDILNFGVGSYGVISSLTRACSH